MHRQFRNPIQHDDILPCAKNKVAMDKQTVYGTLAKHYSPKNMRRMFLSTNTLFGEYTFRRMRWRRSVPRECSRCSHYIGQSPPNLRFYQSVMRKSSWIKGSAVIWQYSVAVPKLEVKFSGSRGGSWGCHWVAARGTRLSQNFSAQFSKIIAKTQSHPSR